jgi:tol-pal system protein YbgF
MRQARVMRYLATGVLLLLTAACANFTGMRTSMPPTPVEPAPGEAAAPAPAPAPDLAQQVQSLQAQVNQLESRLAQLEGPKRAPAPAKERVPAAPAASRAAKPAAPVATVSSAATEKYYTEGMRLYHAKKFGDARTQLHQYLKNQPKGPKAPEARYYLADSFYQEGKYQEAGVEFNKLRLQFPKSILAPAGLLRQALCYKNEQQMSAYQTTLKKLVKTYPGSPEAREAKKMLQETPKAAGQ